MNLERETRLELATRAALRGSTLLGKHRVRLAMLSKQPSYHFSS